MRSFAFLFSAGRRFIPWRCGTLLVAHDAFFCNLALFQLVKGAEDIVEIEVIADIVLKINDARFDPVQDLIVGKALLDFAWELLKLKLPVVGRFTPVDFGGQIGRNALTADLSLIA